MQPEDTSASPSSSVSPETVSARSPQIAADPEAPKRSSTQPKDKSSSAKPKSGHWLFNQRENIITIVLAILLTIIIRTFVAEARWIPSDSMLPTLERGDRLVVEKITYRFDQPRRGDVIVFIPPPSANFDRGAYIKRVIGLPGEQLMIQDGIVYVNQTPLNEPYIAEPPAYDCPGPESQFCSEVQGQTFTIPTNSYFVMGDNRNDSQDSHVWGFLPADNIIGHTVFRFWPLDRLRHFSRLDY